MSPDQPRLSIVIPAYNEHRRLPNTLKRILAYLETSGVPAEVIVADDGSSDDTIAIAESFAGVQVLRCQHRGKGFAVRAGALAAQGSYVLLCDADLAVPIEEWAKLEARLEAGYDLAIGSREGLGAQRQGEPWYRHVMGRVFNLIIRIVALGGIQDTQCGFKALTRPACQDLFQRVVLYGDNAPVLNGPAVTAYDVELLFLARKSSYRIAEVPVLWIYGTETKVNPVNDTLRNLVDVLRVRWNDLRGHYRAALPAAHPREISK